MLKRKGFLSSVLPFHFKPSRSVNNHPFFYFGLPFITAITLGSFVLSHLIQTKIDYNSERSKKLTPEEQQIFEKNLKKPLDIREEYFRLTSQLNLDDYTMVPVPKPSPDSIPPSPGEMEKLLIQATEATLKPEPKKPFRHQYS